MRSLVSVIRMLEVVSTNPSSTTMMAPNRLSSGFSAIWSNKPGLLLPTPCDGVRALSARVLDATG